MSFSADIKECMRTCILAFIWPKKDLRKFFADNGCTKADLKVIEKTDDMSRLAIVDTMFTVIDQKTDGGLARRFTAS